MIEDSIVKVIKVELSEELCVEEALSDLLNLGKMIIISSHSQRVPKKTTQQAASIISPVCLMILQLF